MINTAFTDTFLNSKTANKQKQKILLLIGGITRNLYAFDDLIIKNNINQVGYERYYSDDTGLMAFGGSNTKYLYIKEINCEKYFDSKLLTIFSKPFLLGLPFRLWDKLGDYFKAILNEKKMLEISNCIQAEIEAAQNTYGLEVDIIAHSMGTLLALGAQAKVSDVYLFGSPLTSKYNVIKHTASNYLAKHYKLSSKNIYYGWSRYDVVCSSASNFKSIEYHCSHALHEYLAEALKKGALCLKN